MNNLGLRSIRGVVNQPIPVSVYDTTDKKLVMVFDNLSSCQRYISNIRGGALIEGAKIRGYMERKTRLEENRFGRPIAFRPAKKEHVDLIPKGRKYVILDERFNVNVDVKIGTRSS